LSIPNPSHKGRGRIYQGICYYVNGDFWISSPLMGEGKGEGESIITEEKIL